MKKNLSVCFTAALMIAVSLIVVSSITYAVDTTSDPLVTMSYINEVVTPQIKSELTGYIDTKYLNTVNHGTKSASEYEVVCMKKGQILYALSPIELILRTGKANSTTSFPYQGVADMTSGAEILNEQPLSLNHYCLIPRGDDGRGVVAITDEIYIMVRGEYEIRE